MTESCDPIAAIERCLDDWRDLVHAIMRARELSERAMLSGDAALAAINRHNASAGLPLLREG